MGRDDVVLAAIVICTILLALALAIKCVRAAADRGAARKSECLAICDRIGENIRVLASCSPQNPLRAAAVEPLLGLWEQYVNLGDASAACHLYHSLADNERELRALGDAIRGADFPEEIANPRYPGQWPAQAAAACYDLTVNVRYLGAQLDLV